MSQRLLSASLKLGRAPNMCVAVESSPAGVTAAHNCSMKAIGVQVGVFVGGSVCVVCVLGGGRERVGVRGHVNAEQREARPT